MKSRWDEADAARTVEGRDPQTSELLALRTYSARLLGADPALVLHGGGNTSVKATAITVFGETIDVLHVKGSGWDLATIEPSGHPAVRMSSLLRLLELPTMTDEQMVNELRLALLDASAPTPSVETLLHAALPARFIDHTHADAMLAIVDQSHARAICEEVFGAGLLFVPYVMPGFGLARVCKEAWESATREGRSPTVMVLERHGVFTFGRTAQESYERMIEAVTRAEAYAAARASAKEEETGSVTSGPARGGVELVGRVLPALRGALARAASAAMERAPIIAIRSSPAILASLARADLALLVGRGPATPDHVLRTKPWPMIVDPEGDDLSARFTAAIEAYAVRYDAYFADAIRTKGVTKTKLDPWPRIVLAPGIGICAVGKTKKEAEIAADVYEHTLAIISRAEHVGAYAPVGLGDLFDVEYWSLEQAKLKKEKELPLAGRVALVTGAASGIGRATAARLLDLGAHVVACDRDGEALRGAAAAIGRGRSSQLATAIVDVTRSGDVASAFEIAIRTFGGVDLVVSNAGAAAEGKLETTEGVDALRHSIDLNLLSHVEVARVAVELMRLQGTGGSLAFNASKSAFNQGPGFGPYAVPKAALVSLMRQYAIDLAKDGIRANAVNADRIRTGLFGPVIPGGPSLVASRAAARGITVDEYFRANLLGREVTEDDVADAFCWLAQARATTGCVITVDGGNAAAFPR